MAMENQTHNHSNQDRHNNGHQCQLPCTQLEDMACNPGGKGGFCLQTISFDFI